MKKTPCGLPKLTVLLVGLTALIVLVFVLDALSVPQTVSLKISEDTLLADMLTDTLAPETTAVIAEVIPDTTAETTAETTAPPETEPAETLSPEPVPENDPNTVTLTFLGACSPGSPMGTSGYGSLNAAAQSKGNDVFFSKLSNLLLYDDLTIATNSCVFTPDNLQSELSCAAPVSQAEIYRLGGVDFLSLSSPLFRQTNDSFFIQTKKALTDQSLSYAEENSVTYLEYSGIRIALYCTIVEKGTSTAPAADTVRSASANADYVVVYFWSSDTISSTPEDWLRYSLHQLADAGADLIVGCSEGEIRPVETYQQTTIAYSLGNLINGASFSTDTVSVLLRLTLQKEENGSISSAYTLIPCACLEDRWQPMILPEGETKTGIDSFLAGNSELPLVRQ